MSALIVLRIMLHDKEIGTLAQLPDDRNLFVFNEDYISDPTIEQLNRFSAKVGAPKKLILDTAMETIESFQEHWKHINDLGLSNDLKKIINTHLKKIPLYRKR